MDQVKLEHAQEFRRFLLDNNINYKELNLTHFHIFNSYGVLIAQVWPTTERCSWIVAGLQESVIGLELVKKRILEAYADAPKVNVLRTDFEKYQEYIKSARKLITVTELPTGALEVQINDSALVNKYQYIIDAYDNDMRLKSNPEIQILDFIIV